MNNYLRLLDMIGRYGTEKTDRTGTGTHSIFGNQIRFDLGDGFPLVTTKKVHLKSVIHELLWFIKGDTNIKYLNDNGVKIWDEWADEHGELGPVYGAQWRAWDCFDGKCEVDQLAEVIEQIKTTPDSRRMIVNAWNVADLESMKLPPCHLLYQFEVHDNKLSCSMYQRSCDVFLGLPFNIASYALLTQMIAQVTDLELGDLIISIGDAHIYNNHLDQVKLQLSRTLYSLPTMTLNPDVKCIDDFRYEDFTLTDYKFHPSIAAPIAV